jgi:hypothetical protein
MTSRRYIEAGKSDLPDNFIAIEGNDWKSALSQIERSMRTAPVNYGNFLDNSFLPTKEMDDLLTKLRDGGHLKMDTVGGASKDRINKALSDHFNKIVKDASLSAIEQAGLQEVFDKIRDTAHDVLDVWPGKTNISLSIKEEITLDKPLPSFAPGTFKRDMSWRGLPFFGSTFYVRMSFNSAANAIYDDRNIVKARESEYMAGGLMHFDKEKIKCKPGEEWHPKPWSVSVLSSNVWPHRPVVQSAPRSENKGVPEKRFTVQMVVQRL